MPISDLAGYTWVGNNTIQYDSSFPTYNITFKAYYNNGANFNTGTSLYMESFIDPDIPTPFYGLCGSGLNNFSGVFFSSCIYEGNSPAMSPTTNQATLEYIEFTGGTDANNPTLISMLEANGTLTAPQSQLSVDLTTLSGWSDVSAGNHTLKVKAKATGYRDSALSAGASFEKAEYSYEQSGSTLRITSAPYEQSGGTLIL